MINTVLLIATTFLIGYPVSDRVVGMVGNECITKSDLEEMRLLLPAQISDEELLNHLIEQKLLLIQSERDSVVVKEEELLRAVEGAIMDLKGRFPSDEAYKSELERAGMTEVSLREQYKNKIKEQMSIQKLFQKKFGKELAVSDVEAIEFYKANKDSVPTLPASVKLLAVALKYKISADAQAKTTKKSESLFNRAKKGESFVELVRKYSEDEKTKANGGSLGTLNQNDMGMEFREVVAKLSPGNVGFVESQGAYHVIKCEDRNGEEVTLRDLVIQIKPTKSDSVDMNKRLKLVKNILDTITYNAEENNIPEELQELNGTEILSWGEGFVPLPNTPFTSIENITISKVYTFNVPIGIQIAKPIETQEARTPGWEDLREELKQLIYQRKLNKVYKQLVDKLKQEIYTKSLL